MSICQECADFEVMGEPLPSEEQGWLRVTARVDTTYREAKSCPGSIKREPYKASHEDMPYGRGAWENTKTCGK